MKQREEIDMETIQIAAHAPNAALPTVGPWTIVCSVHGVLGVAITTMAADAAVAEHALEHVASHVTDNA